LKKQVTIYMAQAKAILPVLGKTFQMDPQPVQMDPQIAALRRQRKPSPLTLTPQ
jgi:hypothetical protein